MSITNPSSKPLITLAKVLKVPSLAIGTWAWGDSTIWDNVDGAEQKVEEAFEKILDSMDSVFIDTAELYGKGESERIIGRLLKKFSNHPNISNLTIATKFAPYPWRLSYPSSLLSALNSSLERLQLKQIDLYQIHGPVHLRSIEVLADALAEAQKSGLVKAVGVSNYSVDETKRMYEALKKHGISLASNQVEFSLLRRHPETSGLLKFCKEHDIAVLAFSPLGMGRLTGKYSVENPAPSTRRFSNYPMEEIEPLLSVMRKIAEARNTSVASVALNYTMYKGTIPICGVKNKEQVDSNLKSINWLLKDEEVEELEMHAIEGTTDFFWQHG